MTGCYGKGDYAILQITDVASWNPRAWVSLWYDLHGHEVAFNITSDNYSVLGMTFCHGGARNRLLNMRGGHRARRDHDQRGRRNGQETWAGLRTAPHSATAAPRCFLAISRTG